MPDIEISLLYRFLTLSFDYSISFSDSFIQYHKKGLNQQTDYSSIKSKPELVAGMFWDKVELKTDTGLWFVASGLSKKNSIGTNDELIRSIGNYHIEQISPAYQRIRDSYQRFKGIFGNWYIRHSKVEQWRENNRELVGLFGNQFAIDFLPDEKKTNISKYLELYKKSHDIRESQNQKFTARELEKYQEFFDQVENNPLTTSQRLACVVNEDNNFVIAGAGSGKTSVIIAKAGYLVQSNLAEPHEILILAYGKKASKETDERIKLKLPHIEGVTTSTFHKLGLNIIGSATGKKPRVTKLQDDPAEFYALLNKIITVLTQRDKSYNQRVIDYFVTYLIPYKDEFQYEQQGEYFSALKDGDLSSIKSKIQWSEKRSGKISLQQEQLKSFEEVVIADFLFVNNIQYTYESPYKIDTATQDHSQYHPDFYLPDYDIYIEHFGISREGTTPEFVDQISYIQGIEWKRGLHKQHGTKLVETFSYEMKEGVLTDLLHTKLEKHGVKFNPLSFQELIQLLVNIGDEKKASQFTKLIVTFLDLFKQSGYSIERVREKADQHQDKPRCHAFIDVFVHVFNEYTAELDRSGTVDFSDMIRKATEFVRAGKYIHNFKYILVDEFQDISAIRADLVKSLIEQDKDTSLVCVGDDWQSIYRFSGSDIGFTSNFEKHFGYTKKVPLDLTFRFNNKINSFATTFITKNPAQLKKDVRSHKTVDSNAITLVQYYQDVDRAIQHCVDDIRATHQKPGTIYVLGRYAFCKPAFLQTTAKQYPEFKFLFDTVHGSKGKEADFVIVVDVNDGRYGFPSKIADDPLLELVLPQAESHEHAEERRLFYVAVTRAKHHSYILFDIEKPSEFIQEIREGSGGKYVFNEISTEGTKSAPPDLGKCSSCGTGKIVMRVMPDGSFFFGCGNYPFCKHTPRTCDQCSKYPMIKNGNIYKCLSADCGNIAKACRQCKDGIMVKRSGKFGLFLGCSNYKKKQCKYTEKIVN
ncbi:MAG: UvrD-helicase domain-containing protein [Proteobacteria bacterium]|nr:UvrD-helicase domain-containing protein [Pseudomonadota bacterium]